MAKLYFLNREFKGDFMLLDEEIENGDTSAIELLFADSWYWLHYRFFNCRDGFLSETSSTVRTHLYNFVAALYRQFEELPKKIRRSETEIHSLIAELVEIAEYSRTFPISYWTYGDEVSNSRLQERFSGLPSAQQIERLLELPCFIRMQHDRLPYNYDNEEMAFARYRTEHAAYQNRNQNRKRHEDA